MTFTKKEYLCWKYRMAQRLDVINDKRHCDLTGKDEYHLCVRFRRLCLYKGDKYLVRGIERIERAIIWLERRFKIDD